MGEQPHTSFTIVGAGLAGALMANYLARAGHSVEMYERRSDIRTAEIKVGRSINLALSTRGIAALREVELDRDVLEAAVPMRGRMIHDEAGRLSFQPYSTDPNHAINSVSRAGLNMILLDAAERHPNVRLHFNQKCVDVDFERGTITFEDSQGSGQSTVTADVIIGADGAFSAVRAQMQRRDRFDYRQDYLEHGYKELTIPPGPGGSHLIEKNALHIWPRRRFMMIALPNADGSFTCTLFWPFTGPHGFDWLKTAEEVERYFGEQFPDAVPLMPTLVEDYLGALPNSLVTVRCGPWYVGDRAVLIGDACHAVVPFYGQGMNCAFEDCTELARCLAEFGTDHEQAFATYYERRKEDADALAQLAIDNFVEMRDHVGSPRFLRKKQWERRLHRWLPGWYRPLYNMVTFSQVPYAEAVRQAESQERTIRRVRAAGIIVVALVILLIYWGVYG